MPKSSDFNTAIGMLRQWLNEERITEPDKLVTNEELHHWLDGAVASAIKAYITPYLEYVEEQNGIRYCKNCGLEEYVPD